MCFSAPASFAVAAIIVGNGAYISRYREVPKEAKYIKAIPFIFAIHQVTEGVVWLGYHNEISNWLYMISIYLYTLIANSFWPAYIPFSIFYFEKTVWMRKILFCYFLLGLIGALYLFWAYTFYDPVVLQVNCDSSKCGSLAYNFNSPYFKNIGKYLYLSVILLPLLTTKNKMIRCILFPAFLITFILAKIISQSGAFPSIWCFFSALISLVLVFIFPAKKNI